jgi:hypothetical protein
MFGVLNNIEQDDPAYEQKVGILANPANQSLSAILAIALNVVVGVGVALSIIGVAYSGIIYITSSGDPKNTKKAWDGFLWSAIAAASTLLVFAIKIIALNALGANAPEVRNAVPGF